MAIEDTAVWLEIKFLHSEPVRRLGIPVNVHGYEGVSKSFEPQAFSPFR